MSGSRLETWEDVGARVALARERAGFTQRELAERLKVSRSAVTRVEQGKRQLDALELARLAEGLGRSVEWFLTGPPEAIASHRAELSSDHDVRRLEDELEQLSRDVELLVEVNALSIPPALPQPGVTTMAEAEAHAAEARSVLGNGDGPLLDIQAATARLGLLGFALDLGPAVIDGGYVRLGQLGVALVNGTADSGRRRFNLAHELGHHLLADEYTADFGIGSAGRDDREALINAFAIHFLMPGRSVRQRWEQLAPEWEEPRTRLVVLAAEYRVSWSAVITHATTLELITASQRRRLEVARPTAADYLETGARWEEELRPVSLAPAYSQAVIRAFRRGVISADRAVELLRGTVTRDDLPRPHELPMEALTPEFKEFHRS